MGMATGTATEEELAGARVLRAIGPGQRCRVLLGHIAVSAPPGSLVVLKLVEGDGATAAAYRELVALERAEGEHVLRVLDIARTPGGYALVLERLGGGSFADLLLRRRAWAAGEVVTAVAPLAAALRRMHRAGVAHGALAPAHVVLSTAGSPTLVGFGAAELFAPGSPEALLAGNPAVARDREALRALALELLARVPGERGRAAAARAEQLAVLAPEEVLDVCAEQLFSLAAAMPIAAEDPQGPGAAGAGRLLAPAPGAADPSGLPSAGAGIELLAGVLPDAWLAALRDRLPGGLGAAVQEMLPPVAAVRARSLLAGRGRPLLVGLGAGLVLIAVLLLLPAPGREGPAEEPAPVGPAEPATGHAVIGDDAVAAAEALLSAREDCFREISALCLEAVDQQGSAALERDRAALRSAQAGGRLEPSALLVDASAPLELVEELGGSAIVQAGPEPAPLLLLVRGAGGWRIREIIPAAG